MASQNKPDVIGRIHTTSKGVQIRVKEVDPLLYQTLTSARAHLAPTPPTMTIEGIDGNKEVANPQDQAYQDALKVHKSETYLVFVEALLKRGTEIDLTPEQERQVRQWKAEFLADFGVPDVRSDKLIFIEQFACDNKKDDLSKLIEAVLGSNVPTALQQEEANRTFRR